MKRLEDIDLPFRVKRVIERDPIAFQYHNLYREGKIGYMEFLENVIVAMHERYELMNQEIVKMRSFHPISLVVYLDKEESARFKDVLEEFNRSDNYDND